MSAGSTQTMTQDIDPDVKNYYLGLLDETERWANESTPYQTPPSAYGPNAMGGVMGQSPWQSMASSFLSNQFGIPYQGYGAPTGGGPYTGDEHTYNINGVEEPGTVGPGTPGSGPFGPFIGPDGQPLPQNTVPTPGGAGDTAMGTIFGQGGSGNTMMNAQSNPLYGGTTITGNPTDPSYPGGRTTTDAPPPLYQPPGVPTGVPTLPGGAAGDAAMLRAGQLSGYNAERGYQGMAGYQNPWEEQVVQNTIGDMGRAEAQFREGGIYSKDRGAYGGDRMAIQEGEANRNYMDRVANATSSLRREGFTRAADYAQQDANRQLGGAGLNLGAANSLSAMGSRRLGDVMGAAQGMYGMGANDRGIAQQQLSGDIGYWEQMRNDPLSKIGAMQSVLQGMPVGFSQSSYTPFNPWSAGLGLAGAGLGAWGMRG